MHICIYIIALCNAFVVVSGEKKTKLVNNGYEGVVIAIHPNVPEDAALLDAIKNMMIESSIAMFQATKNRAYFKDITILVPQSWRKGSYSFANSETFDSADIRVAPPHPSLGDNPYAWAYATCGKQGVYIHLTPAYITQDSVSNGYGPRGKVVVHEWGHYRWGVKDEYPTGNNAEERYSNSYYLLPGTTEAIATRCSLGIRGQWMRRNIKCDFEGSPPRDCRFRRFSDQPEGLSASLMYAGYIDEVNMFCHDDETDKLNVHNKDAPNNQNKACDSRSAWDVIMDSVDFQRGRVNSPNPSIANINPNFKVVKHQSKRIVLVLDTSGSMDGQKIMSQRSAAELFISSSIGDGSFIGIVEFDSDASILKYLTEVNHGDGSREGLVQALPVNAGGSTGIGNGILKAIEVLEASGQGAAGGQIIVLTDGEENVQPFVNDVAEAVLEKGIVIYGVFFGLVDAGEAQPLAILSVTSGGNWYFADDTPQSRSQLQNIFATLSRSTDGDLSNAAIQISSSTIQVEDGSTVRSVVAIDSSVGNRTEFIFSWSSIEPEIEITPPSADCIYSNVIKENITYCSVIHVTDNPTSTVKFTIPGTAEVGRWEYSITSTIQEYTTVTVTSAPSTEGVYPITVQPEIQITNVSGNEAALIFALVFQNQVPVLGVNVSATISRPLGEEVILRLFDNGAGADVAINDGVYSRYFTNFSSQGRYAIQVTAQKNGNEPVGNANVPMALGNPGTISNDGTFNPNPFYVEPPSEVSGAGFEGDLERVASGPGVAFTGTITTNDTYPPNKITDLSASQVDMNNATAGIRLTFTAPGDDFDSGTASRYDVRVTNESVSTLLSEFHDQISVNTSLPDPKPSLEREDITITLPDVWVGEMAIRVSIAIRAYDEVDNPSEISNVASTTFFFVPPAVTSEPEGLSTWVIVGAAVGGGLVLIILVTVLVCVLHSKRKN